MQASPGTVRGLYADKAPQHCCLRTCDPSFTHASEVFPQEVPITIRQEADVVNAICDMSLEAVK